MEMIRRNRYQGVVVNYGNDYCRSVVGFIDIFKKLLACYEPGKWIDFNEHNANISIKTRLLFISPIHKYFTFVLLASHFNFMKKLIVIFVKFHASFDMNN